MYELNSDGSSTGLKCSNSHGNLTHWGCTAILNDPQHAYPFSSNPVTVDIEGNDPGDPQHGFNYNRYLRDVVPEEIAIKMSSRGNKPLSTVKAQAIAARTYVYFRHGLTINNSAQYQVFVPYYYDTLTLAQQQRVDEAASEHIIAVGNQIAARGLSHQRECSACVSGLESVYHGRYQLVSSEQQDGPPYWEIAADLASLVGKRRDFRALVFCKPWWLDAAARRLTLSLGRQVSA